MNEVEKLTCYFGNIIAIEDVTFKVEKGEVLDFFGPNAAGKNTKMRILTCFLPASKGTARVANSDVFQHPLEVKKRISCLPENPPLSAEMTVYSNFDFIAKIKGLDPRIRKQKIDGALKKTELDDRINTVIKQLSIDYQKSGMHIVAFGDSDFATNDYFHLQGDGDLFRNTISWLAEQGDLISIRAKQSEINRNSLTARRLLIIFWFGVVLLQLTMLIAGIAIYVQRK